MKSAGIRLTIAAGATLLFASSAFASPFFMPGNLVVSVEGNGVYGASSGPYGDNQAAPLTLFQFSHSGTSSAAYVNSLVLPQSNSGRNYAVSGEYGSSSEGGLQLSGNGQYLTIMGYGVNAAQFNAHPTAYGTSVNDPTKPNALAQSGSLTGQSYTAVARVAALIDSNGTVDSSTALFNVFNGNNPRSAYSANGTSFYVSGQGVSGGPTGGVFFANKGSSSATAITGLDTSSHTAAQDTRVVHAYNNQLYVSVDSKQGSGSNRDFIGTLGSSGNPPISLANGGNGPTMLSGFGNAGGTGKYNITAANTNGINAAGKEINLSPEDFFFANPYTLYVADSGAPKNDSVTNDSHSSTLGDGGLQKWINSRTDGTGTWTLAYTLAAGLNLVSNTSAHGSTGLLGLTGLVVDAQVELFATNYTIGDTDQTYLYGITDILSANTRPNNEFFTALATAPTDSTFKGVSFTPYVLTAQVPEPSSMLLLAAGLLVMARARRKAA